MKPSFKRALPHIGFLLLMLLFSAVYYGDMLTRLPYGIHDWAQGDRLSLAINFYDNGLNFFKPATHALISIDGIVGVEFPLQSYIAGALGYIFGRDGINTCFRVEGILIAWMGLYFLFRAVYNRTRDFLLAILPPVIFFCSPVFVFYSASYLPDPAGVCVAFAALYFFLQYADGGRLRRLMIAIAILTLAVLIKATTASCWAAVVGYGLYEELFVRRNRKHALMIVGAAALSCAVIGAQLWYIFYLNETYKSTLFLSKTEPFKDWTAFNDFAENNFKDLWMLEYFLPAEYPVLIFGIALGIRVLRKTAELRRYLRPLIVFVPGVLVLFWLFGNQFFVHDYYVMAIFFPLIAYLLVTAMIGIHRRFSAPDVKDLRTGLAVTALFLFFMADHQLYNRIQLKGRYNDTYSFAWWVGGERILDSVKVPKAAPILVCGDSPPNLALVYFDHKGRVMPQDNFGDHIGVATEYLKSRGWNYLVLKEGPYRQMAVADTPGMASYDVLFVGKDKAVLRLKPGH